MFGEDLTALLLGTAHTRADFHGFVFPPEVLKEFEEFVSSGVMELSDSERRSELVIDKAKVTISDLVDQLMIVTEETGQEEHIDIFTFRNVIKGFCPRFPIC